MKAFWDNKFREEKTNWGFVPSDSAIFAKDFFLANNARDILLPGIGYGRNAKIFHESGIKVTGIEISKYAIEMAKTETGLDIPIYHGSVTDMPFDDRCYDGIFCYALIHLLNSTERKRFIRNCYDQLGPGGTMIFTVISTKSDLYGKGKLLSINRYELMKGLMVYFYDMDSVYREFSDYGLFEVAEIDEPIKHMPDEPPLKCIWLKCRKNK
jgi:SAM-dependent methyltransferase